MSELLFKAEVFQLVGFCMEIHRELGKGHDEVIYKDALTVELSRAQIAFAREKNYEVAYKGVILSHFYYADFVVWDNILFEGKTVQKLNDAQKAGAESPCCLKTSSWFAGELRWRFFGMEANCALKNS